MNRHIFNVFFIVFVVLKPMWKTPMVFIGMLAVVFAHGSESKISVKELLFQTDVVVVGKLSNVKEWDVDDVRWGEGTIQVSEVLDGEVPLGKEITLRWSNPIYRSGVVEFKDTGAMKFVWLLWKPRDGTFRARHSSCQSLFSTRDEIMKEIQKQKKLDKIK